MELTLAQAIKTYMETVGHQVSSADIKHQINTQYPGRWKAATIQTLLYACVVNQPKAYVHYPSDPKFMYKNSNGYFELYSEGVHGANVWAPTIGDDDADVEQLVESSITLERDLEDHLVSHLGQIEKGLQLVERQHSTDVGRIDILAIDKQGRHVPIEIKVGKATDAAIGQIARYIGWFHKTDGEPSRGILIAGEFPEDVRHSLAAIPGLMLLTYRVHFSFERTA
jgi:hypothetical protein